MHALIPELNEYYVELGYLFIITEEYSYNCTVIALLECYLVQKIPAEFIAFPPCICLHTSNGVNIIYNLHHRGLARVSPQSGPTVDPSLPSLFRLSTLT